MTIYENIATVPKLLKWDNERTEKRVEELLHIVGLPPEEFKKDFLGNCRVVSNKG